MKIEKIIREDQFSREVEVWDDDVLLHTYVQSLIIEEEVVPETDALIASISAMDSVQKAALRKALGI